MKINLIEGKKSTHFNREIKFINSVSNDPEKQKTNIVAGTNETNLAIRLNEKIVLILRITKEELCSILLKMEEN